MRFKEYLTFNIDVFNWLHSENILFLYGNKIKDFLDVENYLFYEEDDVKFLIENNFEYLVGNLD